MGRLDESVRDDLPLLGSEKLKTHGLLVVRMVILLTVQPDNLTIFNFTNFIC